MRTTFLRIEKHAANIAQHTFLPESFQGERWPEIANVTASDWNICRRMKHSDLKFWF